MSPEDFRHQGNKDEEKYFYNLNKELIEKKRKELNVQREEQKIQAMKEEHWMRCPKCGQQMEEIAFMGVMVDHCTSCSGIYFDKGELDLILESKERKGFLNGLKRRFK